MILNMAAFYSKIIKLRLLLLAKDITHTDTHI